MKPHSQHGRSRQDPLDVEVALDAHTTTLSSWYQPWVGAFIVINSNMFRRVTCPLHGQCTPLATLERFLFTLPISLINQRNTTHSQENMEGKKLGDYSDSDLYDSARKVVLTAEQAKIECEENVNIPDDVKEMVNKLLETAEYDYNESDKEEPWSAFAKWGASFAQGATKEAATENLRWQLELEILSQRAVNRLTC